MAETKLLTSRGLRWAAPQPARTVAAVFADWREAPAALLAAHGPAPVRARRPAVLVIASVEGAVAKCKAERSITPLDDVAPEIRALLSGAPVYRGQLTEPHDTTPPTDQE